MLRIRFVAIAASLITALLSSAAFAVIDSREAPVTPEEYADAVQNPPICARNALALKAIELNLQQFRNTPGRKLMIETKNALLCAMEDGDVKTLERLTDSYAKDRTLNFGGSWKIEQFFEAISFFLDAPARDQQFGLWQALYKKWISAYPKSLTAPIAHASALQDEAWSYRGAGYANAVRRGDWVPFTKHMQDAVKVLEATKATAAKNPRWYAQMISIEGRLGTDRKQLLALAREGMKKFPESHDIYQDMMDMLSPKWGGDVYSMEAWAREAVEATKAVTGTGAYALAYKSVMLNKSGEEVRPYRIDWSYYSQSAEDLLKYYPSMETADSVIRVSCHSLDAKVVSRLRSQTDRIYLPLTNWTQMSSTAMPPEEVCNWKKNDIKIPNTGVISPEELFLKQQQKSGGWQ